MAWQVLNDYISKKGMVKMINENIYGVSDTDLFNNITSSDRKELFSCLIDVVEDWLYDKGFTPNDFPNDDRNFPIVPDEAIIFGEDYDYLADRFSMVLGIPRD